MATDSRLERAVSELLAARADVTNELKDYPGPVSGCDAQFNHLISVRNAIGNALVALESPPFVATPRTPSPEVGVESR